MDVKTDIYRSTTTLIKYLEKFDVSETYECCLESIGSVAMAWWQNCVALPDTMASLKKYQVQELTSDYINNLAKDHFLNIPVEYFSRDQISQLGYQQIDWLIGANKTIEIVDALPARKLFFVLVQDKTNAPKIFKNLSTTHLDTLLELGETATQLRVQEVMRGIFSQLGRKATLRCWKKHFYQIQCVHAHNAMLYFLNNSSYKPEIIPKLPPEELIELFTKIDPFKVDDTLVDLLEISQIIALVKEAAKLKTPEKLSNSVSKLLMLLPQEKIIEALRNFDHLDYIILVLSKIRKRVDAAVIAKELSSDQVEVIFITALQSTNKCIIASAILAFKTCGNRELVCRLVEYVNEADKVDDHFPNLFVARFLTEMFSYPEMHRNCFFKSASPMLIVNQLAIYKKNDPKAFSQLIMDFLKDGSPHIPFILTSPIVDLDVKASVLDEMIQNGAMIKGLLHTMPKPIEVLLKTSIISADNMRTLLQEPLDTSSFHDEAYLKAIEDRLDHPNIARAAACLDLPFITLKTFPRAACMLAPKKILRILAQESKLDGEWLLDSVENLFEEGNSACFQQVKALFHGMTASHKKSKYNDAVSPHQALIEAYFSRNKKIALNFDFLAWAILYFPEMQQEHILDGIEKHWLEHMSTAIDNPDSILETGQPMARVDIIPPIILKALCLNQKKKTALQSFITLLSQRSYGLHEILPNFNTLEQPILCNASQEIIYHLFDKAYELVDPKKTLLFLKENAATLKSASEMPAGIEREKIENSIYTNVLGIFIPINFLVVANKILASEENQRLAPSRFWKKLTNFFDDKSGFLTKAGKFQKCIDIQRCIEMQRVLEMAELETDVWRFLGGKNGIVLTESKIRIEIPPKALGLEPTYIDYVSDIMFLSTLNITSVADLIKLNLYRPGESIVNVLERLKELEKPTLHEKEMV